MKISKETYQRLLNNSINLKQNKYKNKKVINKSKLKVKDFLYYKKIKTNAIFVIKEQLILMN